MLMHQIATGMVITGAVGFLIAMFIQLCNTGNSKHAEPEPSAPAEEEPDETWWREIFDCYV